MRTRTSTKGSEEVKEGDYEEDVDGRITLLLNRGCTGTSCVNLGTNAEGGSAGRDCQKFHKYQGGRKEKEKSRGNRAGRKGVSGCRKQESRRGTGCRVEKRSEGRK